MRSEQEMLDLIVGTAQADDRIRAVILNGSRANPNAKRDLFQDYDIVYVVTEMAPFVHNLAWIRRFGELMVMQLPDEWSDAPASPGGSYGYLMQFMDGNRIDLTLIVVDRLAEMGRDSLSVLLLDKDDFIEPFPPPHEGDYLPAPPSAQTFFECCNEFWWVSPYVAKALWRDEILYAKELTEQILRRHLMQLLVWRIGSQTNFAVNPGKGGKYFRRYLEPQMWGMLLKSYAAADVDATWDALEVMCDLFRIAAVATAAQFAFDYPYQDDERVTAFLRRVRTLPQDADTLASP